MNKQAIHEFAIEWLEKISDDDFNPYLFFEGDVGEKWFALGFEMDCGNGFQAAYPDSNPFNNVNHLEQVIDGIDDIILLGDAIFSKWRYFNHWAMEPCEPDDIRWFEIAFTKLAEITK